MKLPRFAYAISELLLSLGRVVDGEAAYSDLNGVQWSALRFVATADPTSRTVGAFARLQRTTPSSASQTMSSLVRRGYLRKRPGEDRRVRSLELTAKGERALAADPIHELARRVATLPADQRILVATALEHLIRADLNHVE